VRAADATETAFFKLPDDGRVAIFEVRRTAFDGQGKPFRLTVSVYPADRNQFAVLVGELPDQAVKPPGLESPEAETASPRKSAAKRPG
jgi:GntR family transcriptional regulator